MWLCEDVRREGIKPTIVTYNDLTIVFEKAKDLTQALRLFEEVLRPGIKPPIVTYLALTAACEKGQETQLYRR